MFKLIGEFNEVTIMAETIDDSTHKQILSFLNNPNFQEYKIIIMPDCHAGAGAVTGFTADLNGSEVICPNIVGVDVGCGVLTTELSTTDIDLESLDIFIKKNIPMGFNKHEGRNTLTNFASFSELAEVSSLASMINNYTTLSDSYDDLIYQLGTLGGGNHFIEVDKSDNDGRYWLTIHTGSRNIGFKVSNYFQNIAKERGSVKAFKGQEVLRGLAAAHYYYLIDRLVNFAKLNRKIIQHKILHNYFKDHIGTTIDTVHNYIDTSERVIRKGAISAYAGQTCVIPFNMRDGIAICEGLGNEAWNKSAPHGAGRIMSRSQAKKELTVEEYKEAMTGIYSSTINSSTLDEAPQVYKNKDEIVKLISDTVHIKDFLRPIYNVKGGK
jgi:RNA-splicing ligase RtcB